MPAQAIDATANSRKPSARARLRAWWEGATLAERLSPTSDSAPRDVPPSRPAPITASSTPRQSILGDFSDARIAACELLWGEGELLPGGEAFNIDLVKPVGLTAEMTVLDLNAGVGGMARLLATTYGSWVTGMTPLSQLAAIGKERSRMAGLTRKADLKAYDPETATLKERGFDFIIARAAPPRDRQAAAV